MKVAHDTNQVHTTMKINEIRFILVNTCVLTQFDAEKFSQLSDKQIMSNFADLTKKIKKLKNSYVRAKSKVEFHAKCAEKSCELMREFREILYSLTY